MCVHACMCTSCMYVYACTYTNYLHERLYAYMHVCVYIRECRYLDVAKCAYVYLYRRGPFKIGNTFLLHNFTNVNSCVRIASTRI